MYLKGINFCELKKLSVDILRTNYRVDSFFKKIINNFSNWHNEQNDFSFFLFMFIFYFCEDSFSRITYFQKFVRTYY